jgi:hypothetical protein
VAHEFKRSLRTVEAQNDGYVSRSVAVPIDHVLDAIRGASEFRPGAP